ncbi:haloacid dehalogenase [Polycladomyces abyssicola]|uniref:Haloacid dehalogenase n=1 Tax=Polycladomyces abyssicola TaxID=1125966 RepID=A0A8D5UCR8_9BACL|nr:Cof-type HAD-IIB family hydrolase [Polycladomyces abyssicola]BCU80996.1 haloacid dehalogenase [Polycladomyces abyssicola]
MTLAYRLLVSDIDGTIANSAKEIADVNRRAISLYRQSGGQFTLATGRSYAEAKRFIDLLKPDLPVILCNGAVLYDPSSDRLTPIAVLQRDVAVDVLKKLTGLCLNIDIFVYTSDAVYATQIGPLAQAGMDSEDFQLEIIESFDLLTEVPWIKFVVVADHEEMKQLHAWSKTVNHDLEFVQSSDHYFEILPPNISKGAALARIAKERGIPSRQIATIGDHLNDLSMLRMAGLSAAVANAHPHVMQTTDIVVPSNDEGGVAYLIHHYLLNDMAIRTQTT